MDDPIPSRHSMFKINKGAKQRCKTYSKKPEGHQNVTIDNMGQSIQKWTKKNLWKTAFKRIKRVRCV